MAKQGIQFEIDKQSFDNFNKQLEILKEAGRKSMYWAIVKVAMKIKSEAQLRLTGRGHIKTSRLKNSIFVQAKNIGNVTRGKDNQLTYTADGKSYSSIMQTVTLTDDEIAIGSNVEYASAIEFGFRPHVIEAKRTKALKTPYGFFKKVNHPGFGGDSFLYWAMKNVNVGQSVAKDMADDIKFGRYLKGNVNKIGKSLTNSDL